MGDTTTGTGNVSADQDRSSADSMHRMNPKTIQIKKVTKSKANKGKATKGKAGQAAGEIETRTILGPAENAGHHSLFLKRSRSVMAK